MATMATLMIEFACEGEELAVAKHAIVHAFEEYIADDNPIETCCDTVFIPMKRKDDFIAEEIEDFLIDCDFDYHEVAWAYEV
jgi:hypothetical protein